MTDNAAQQDRRFFTEQGYLVARGLLDVGQDIGPFAAGFGHLLDGMADVVIGEDEPGLGDFKTKSIASRLAMLVGSGGREVLDHLEPTLSSVSPDWRWRADFPSAQFAELFALMRSARLLEALENLLGSEIVCSPSCHMNMKLGSRDRDAAASIAAARREAFDKHELSGFLVAGASHWHADGSYGLPGSYRITAWIPITEATLETGCLRVVPGSHRHGPLEEPVAQSVIDRAIDLPTSPGDVIFLDNWMLHGARSNRTENQFRWAINSRYRRTNEPADFVHLPSFVALSQRAPEGELRDPELWCQMWRHALRYAAKKRLPSRGQRKISRAVADALRAHWQAKISSHADWLALTEDVEKPQ